MENYLIPACILLALTNLSFALLALSWKKKAAGTDQAMMRLLLKTATAHREGFDDGYQQASKVAIGGLHLAALRAGADDQVLKALKMAGKRLLGEEIDEPVVQVPDLVYDQTR